MKYRNYDVYKLINFFSSVNVEAYERLKRAIEAKISEGIRLNREKYPDNAWFFTTNEYNSFHFAEVFPSIDYYDGTEFPVALPVAKVNENRLKWANEHLEYIKQQLKDLENGEK